MTFVGESSTKGRNVTCYNLPAMVNQPLALLKKGQAAPQPNIAVIL